MLMHQANKISKHAGFQAVSKLNMFLQQKQLNGFKNKLVCDFLEYGFPSDFNKTYTLASGVKKNQKGAQDFSSFPNKYLKWENNVA